MLTYYLNPTIKKPLYEQLYEQLKQSIVNGEIKQHEKMPSKRTLSNHLKVSLSTVENAYAQLIVEGYIVSIEKKGYFAHYDQSIVINPPNQIESKTSTIQTKLHSYKYHLHTNHVDAHLFPLSAWIKISKKLLDESPNTLINASDRKGHLPLRVEIKTYLKQYRGMDVSEEQIIMGAGSEVLLSLISDIIGHEACIGVENPGYQKSYHILKQRHQIIPIPLDHEGLNIKKETSDRLDVIHITPSHQFPSGIIMPISRRLEILQWVYQKNNRFIIEDDYDSEFRFTGQPIQALYALDQDQKVIYMNSFSKSLSPTMRLSYMVLPKRLLTLFDQNMIGYHPSISNLTQFVLTHFFKDGMFYKHLNKMKVKYKQKRDEFIKSIKDASFGDDIIIKNADAGLHFILEHKYIDAEVIAKKAKTLMLDVKTIQEHAYEQKCSIQNGLIIGYAHLETLEIPEIVQILEKAMIVDV
jgi:GntR family transcriptional regulator / MocR family aminotransferase